MKKAYFYIDDTIWVLRDITKQKPKSIFDNMLMKALKTAHDKYNLKVQFNLFYRTSSFYDYNEFSLSDVTDAYKDEFSENSDWIKFAFHALEEFPDYPHVNATYEDTKKLFDMIENEVFRFAGKDCFSYIVCPHWGPMSKMAVRALADSGVKMIYSTVGTPAEYTGDPNCLPYGHAQRLLHNRQAETKLLTREFIDPAVKYSMCAYNHISDKENDLIFTNCKAIYNDEFKIRFKCYGSICLNLLSYDELDVEFGKITGNEYIGICDHEQYFYPDYFNYQKDYADKIYKMCEILAKNDFIFVSGEEILE